MSNKHIFGSADLLKTCIAAILAVFGLASCSVGTINVEYNPSNNPTVTISATPALIASGGTSVITWSSSNATSCTSSGGGGTGASGSFTTPALTSTTTYVVTCTGPDGIESLSTTVTLVTDPPVVTVLATPSSIEYGATAEIAWTSTNSTSCTSSWGGAVSTAGTYTTPALTISRTYTVICAGPIGVGSDYKTVTVNPTPIPVVTLSALQPTIISGASTVITWSSLNTTSCVSSGGGGTGISGSFTTPPLTATTTYFVTCTDSGGAASQSVTVTVVQAPVPVVTLTAAPSSIAFGATTVISWSSTNATSCILPSGVVAGTSGTFTTPALFANTTYIVTCSDGGGPASQNITITVAAAAVPVVTLTATPTSIISGSTSVLNWTSTNSVSCISSGGGGTGTTGSFTTPALSVTTVYTVTCSGLGGTSASQSTTVTVTAAPVPVVTLSASTTSIINGATTVITWSSTNSTSCISPSGALAGTSGTYTTPALTATTIYSVTCTGLGDTTAIQSITITVAPALPTVTLTATPASIISGTTSVLSWTSTNSTSCISPSGVVAGTTGSFTTPALTVTTVYTMTCTGPGGTTAIQSTTVTVTAVPAVPVVTVLATPSSIISGATSVITWTSSNSTSCTSSGGGGTGTSGTFTTPSLTVTTAYTVTCTGSGGTASQIATVTVPSGLCVTTGDIANIALPAVIPSRLSGVAPLSVFFESLVTSATSTTRPFHDLEHRWNFVDTAGGSTWNAGSRAGVSSRNTATGPETAHVFETPGAYNFSLSVTDGTHTVTNICTQIVVQDPAVVFAGSNTTCVAATSLPVQGVDGCPPSANTAQQPNFATAVNSFALTGRRVLFKRGDTFSAPSSAAITRTGPGIIGAFGTGAAPSVQMTGGTPIISLSSATTTTIKDWRVMDLDLNGMSNASSMGVGTAGSINQVTLLRLNIHDTHNGISFSDSLLDWLNNNGYPGQTMWDQIAIVDSSVLHTIGGAGGNGVGVAAKRLSMLGNIVDDSLAAEHILRVFNVNRGVISNNTLSRQAAAKAIIKMHGPTWLSGTPPTGVAGSYTELAVLSDNKFVSADGTDWTINTGPQNAQSDERLRNIIFERNWFIGGNTTQVGLVVNAVDETVRNNISVNTAGKFMQVSYRSGASTGLEPPPLNVHIYNNTVYSSSAQSGDLIGVDIRAPSANTVVYNNLGTGPFASILTMVSNAGTGTVQGNNPIYLPSVLFASATPAIPSDFSLKALPNPARDTGFAAVPVYSDFFRTGRPLNGVIDIGAIEGL